MDISRRIFTRGMLAGMAVTVPMLGRAPRAEPEVEDVRQLKPSEFVWHPERAAAGPMAIVVSVPDQLVYVYRDGIRIGVSTCATGRPGHATPTGVFTILQKQTMHHSNLYNNAPMPFMERLTWSGVALHAGDLPGYPDSHGCVHLPIAFARLLYDATQVGTPVIIADSSTAPAEVLHPGLLWSAAIEQDVQSVEKPAEAAGAGALSVLISGADREIFALQNGAEVIKAQVTIIEPDQPLGTHVYVFAGRPGGGGRWLAVSVGKSAQAAGNGGGAKGALQRVQLSADTSRTLQPLLHAGSTLMITDLPATAETRSGSDFVILRQGTA